MTDKELRGLGDWIAINIFNYIPCRGRYWNGAVNHGKFNCKPDEADCWAYEYNGGNACGNDGKTYCSIDTYNWRPYDDPATAMKVLKKCLAKEQRDSVSMGFNASSLFSIWDEVGDQERFCESESLELAICLFAKKMFSK